MTITEAALAVELRVPEIDVRTYVDQLVSIDGCGAVIDHTATVRDASWRTVGSEVHLTDSAADFLREMHAKGDWNMDNE
jgi:hypothetical protein